MASFQSAVVCQALAHILLYGALLTPPSLLSHHKLASLFLPLIWACHIHSWSGGLGVFSAVHALWSTDLLLFRRPRELFCLLHRKADGEFQVVGKNSNEGDETYWRQPYPDKFGARFWWVNKLVASPRFVGWDVGDGVKARELPCRNENIDRAKWLFRMCLNVIINFVLVDATNAFQLYDPYFTGVADIDSALPHVIMGAIGDPVSMIVSPRCVRLLIFGIQQYSIFTLVWALLGIFCLSLNAIGLLDDFWGSIDNFQPLWGNPMVVLQRGLRGFWATFWHQLFRHILADPGRALAKALGVPDQSTIGFGLRILVAFFLSGALHAFTLPLNIPELYPLRYAAFFWVNGVCVILEILVGNLLKRKAERQQIWLRIPLIAARLIWTCGVLYATGPLLTNETLKVSLRLGKPPVLLFPTADL